MKKIAAIVSLCLFSILAIPILPAQTYKVIYTFTFPPNPEGPYAGLIAGAGGMYGTTVNGPSQSGQGTVYKLTSKGETTLYFFSGSPDGAQPYAPLIKDSAGNFYGTTGFGGSVSSNCASGCGTVFKISPAGTESVLYRFTGGVDGANPYGGLVRDAAGNFYGTTSAGGDLSCYTHVGCGTVFKLDTSGKLTTLHAFSGGADGSSPQGGLVRDGAGNLYGVTVASDTIFGTIFKVGPNGAETVLHTFSKQSSPKEGADPKATLIRDSSGNLYGSTFDGGPSNFGTIFELTAAGNLVVLHSFTGASDGGNPSEMIRDSSGNLYGVAAAGGTVSTDCSSGCGTLFVLSSGANASFKVLHAFGGFPNDGANPFGRLRRDSHGRLFGTTFFGGSANFGTIFQLTP